MLENVEKGTGQREVRPVWNNPMRTNHQNFSNSRRNFALTTVLTKSGIVPISIARQSSSRAATPVSAARPINTDASKLLVNVAKPRQNALQNSRRPFYQQTALKNRNLNNKVNTAKANYVNTTKGNKVTSVVGKQGINTVKFSACWGDLQDALKDQGYFDSGCSRHMTGNISYLTEFKENGEGYVAFEGGAKVIRLMAKAQSELNRVMNEFCKEKGIKREYSVARTPQQNKVAERRNRTLIEAARTMLADSKLATTFWAKAVNTACYVVKPHFKTPYEMFKGRSPALSFMRPFGYHVTILNTLDQLGKFNGKSDERIFVGYSTISGRPEWLFDIDGLSKLTNYALVLAGPSQDYILMPLWKDNSLFYSSSQDSDGHNKDKHGPSQASESDNQKRPNTKSSTKIVNTVGPVNTATPTYANYPSNPLMPDLEDIGIFDDDYDDRDKGAEADYNNLETIISMEPNRVTQALYDESWVEAMHEELLQFKLPNVWTLVDLRLKKRAIRTKWVYRNKRDQRGIVVRNKARLAIRLSLAYASFMDFIVYQIDVKSAFLYGIIKEAVYVSQPLGVVDPEFSDRVVKSASTPIETHKPLSKDAAGTDVDAHLYRSMIGSLMYLTSSRTDIMFAVCACSRFQVQPKVFYMHAVKRIFRYLKGQPTLVLWYPKDSPLELIAYSNSDYAGASLDRKSTTGGCQFLGLELKGYLINDGYADLVQHADKKELAIPWQTTTGKELSNPLMAVSLLKTIKPFSSINNSMVNLKFVDQHNMVACLEKSDDNTEFHQIVDFLSLCYINYALTQIHTIVDGKAIVISESSVRSDILFDDEDGITCLINDDIFENLALMGYEPLSTKLTFQKGHTSRSGEERMENTVELIDTVPPTPYDSPLTGGYTPESYEGRLELEELMDLCTTLSNRVSTLENKLSSTKVVYHKAFITLTKRVKKLETQLKQKRSKAVIYSSNEEELSVHIEDSPKQERMIKELDKDEDVNLASQQGEVQETTEPSKDDDDATLAVTLLNIKRSTTKDKGKGIMQETELPKKIKKRKMIQLSLDEELAQNLYAEELAKETARQEHEKYNLEKALELQRQLDKREKDVDKSNQAQKIDWNDPTGMYKKSYFKGVKYEDIKPIFKRVWDQVHTFVPKDSEIKKELIKRSGFHFQQESSKKQKLDQQIEEKEEEAKAQADSDQEVEEMKLYMWIVPDEDIAIDTIPLATKPLMIVEYKIVKEGKISTYHITRADGSTKRPEEGYERVLWGDPKVMFEPDIESEVWRKLHGYHVIVWKLFSSSGVHFVRFKNLHIFMMVDKAYPLTPATITKMLERKLQADQWNEMCYQLLKFMLKQQRKR
nr:hypothetical protein [Tanacetum cinerariifolium]